MPHKFDSLYATPLSELVDFSFDIKVAGVFADMIQRSVPGYATVLANIGVLTRRYVQPDSVCYDLGCSLGAATLAMRTAIKQNGCRIIAVDNAPAMLARCREIIAADTHPIPVELVEADINKIVLKNASVVVLNLTLQFVPLLQRADLLSKIYRGLLPGGVLLLAEKICFDDPAQNAAMIEWHHDFKRVNGYSELEISQKRSTLEKVLLPETMQSHVTRLQQAGFDPVHIWFQCFNFMALLAFK